MIKKIRHAAAACLGAALLALSACGGGAGSSAPSTAPAAAEPPTAVIRATALAATGTSNATVQAPVGSTLTLDGSSSTAAGSISSYLWTVSAKPAGSTAALQNATAATATFVPDVAGNYQFTLQVGANGTTASTVLPVTVTAAVPVVNVDAAVNFAGPVSNRPTQSVSAGSVVTLDGAGSTDANGGAVTLAFTLLSAPSGSTAKLSSTSTTARLTPDVVGTYQVRVRATSLSGLYADAVHTFDVGNLAPTVVVSSSVSTVSASSSLDAPVGSLVSLDGGGSYAPSGSADSSWSVVDKPWGSALTQLINVSPTAISFVPDAAGSYTLQFAVLDRITGASAFHRVTVKAAFGPIAVVSASAAPVAQAGGPSYVAVVGSAITLRGSGSQDPAGGALTYSWTLDTRPAGSTTTLSDAGTATPSFTPDRDGRYSATLTVTNAAGLRAVQSVNVDVGNRPPVVVLDRSQAMVLLGGNITASAASSYSRNNNGTLTYSWALDTRPAGSNASPATTNTATLNLTPDVPGDYYASVTVSDGQVSAVAGVSISVLSATAGTVPLAYKPLLMRFSRSQNKLVVVSANPNQLHLVDPSAGTDLAIALPTAVKALSLSADGRLAGVLYEGSVSLVDVAAGTLLNTTSTNGTQTEVLTANSGIVFVMGQSSGSYGNQPITAINARTGAILGNNGPYYSGYYGVTRGVLSESLGRAYLLPDGYGSTSWTAVNVANGSFPGSTGGTPSSATGDYSMTNPLWLSTDESLLFSARGNYFRTSDLQYLGTLGGPVLSVSHSATAAEAIAIVNAAPNGSYSPQYPEVLKRFTGSLLFPAGDIRLPVIGGTQSYGIAVFHASDDRRVAVVQTGSSDTQASGVQYFLVVR
ncbi:PKD domain-containing protein [Roseateles cellulosilyticus]|uniref:PKD domain-containing protein n=1 Tax=Pelomonas cellulosilytica TaxID=2906762 RepID=A0ABS8Y2X3_9BURK|nr:PKD domain-containing protein [Pelomonas sp. P8]MCE4557476.1 PKD domain-containing protein [Pelomonas sp. P8]